MPARCRKCHRVLTTTAAVEAGYGPVCYAKEFGKSLYSTSKVTRSAGSSPRIRMRIPQAAKRKKIEPMPLLAADVTCSRDADGKAHVNIPRRICYHSPSGFEWGYGGSGPAQRQDFFDCFFNLIISVNKMKLQMHLSLIILSYIKRSKLSTIFWNICNLFSYKTVLMGKIATVNPRFKKYALLVIPAGRRI